MADPTTPAPVKAVPDGRPLRISPTDVSQFVRLDQCERYLRFRLAERDGQKFMRAYDVTPQRITPLLTRAGLDFEDHVEGQIARSYPSVHYAEKSEGEVDRPEDNLDVAGQARLLAPGATVVLFQPRLRVEVDGWLIRGDVDLLRLERDADGTLNALIADMKSTTEVKVEHRLQVAFYHLMLARLFADHGLSCDRIRTGIIFRGEDEADRDDPEPEALRSAAGRWLGLDDALLEVVDDPDAYLRSARDLVTGPDSTARRVAQAPFDELPFALNYKCDGCLYNEYCMKWCAEHEDLSLLPHLAGIEKEALRRDGIATIESLATLKEFAAGELGRKGDLVPSPGREAQIRRLATTWPVGPRLDELVHRARSFRRRVRKDDVADLSYIPGKGSSSLPVSAPELNPNLVRVYIDAQHDYLNDRLYLLGGLVVACRDGTPDPERRRCVVRMTEGPPREASEERRLLVEWTRELLEAVVELAIPGAGDEGRKSAPIHLIFFNRYEQRTLLEALARNFPPLMEASPPLYDFLTQLAAFDSPIATFLDEEVRAFKNFPMTCQSLQSLAAYLKFDWNRPERFRELFKSRLFDYLGRMEIDGQPEWFTRRSRFNSQVPLEYAYAAWGELPSPGAKADDFADFRPATRDLLLAFQRRRLEALEQVADSCGGNPDSRKTPFVLPDLAGYEDKARDLAQALHEFVTIERHVALGGWKRTRHAPAERRALMGETLLGRYVGADQDPAVAARVRENLRRHRLRQEYEAAYRAANPDAGKVQLSKEQNGECQWSPEGLTVRLRLEASGLDCDLHDALAMTNLRPGDRLVVYARWTVDERLPEAERKDLTPSPKAMLYGNRAELKGIVATEHDDSGRILAGHVDLRLSDAFGGEWGKGYVFGSINKPLEEGKLYTLDECPNDWYGLFCREVVDGLRRGEPNALYRRLSRPDSIRTECPPIPGQARFLEGLDAFRAAGLIEGFEEGKRDYIGGHGRDPILLVQGPPGTGKSFSTAFAVLARIQGAMEAGADCRVFAGCKTHAATDVLIKSVLHVRETLRGFRGDDPCLFDRYFDARLLDMPVFRVAPHDPPPAGVGHLIKDRDKPKGSRKNADIVRGERWAVVGATPGGVYRVLKDRYDKSGMFRQEFCDCLVLDEASQMNLPEAIMAALALRPGGQLIVVGDHRQMPPIVQHEWDTEPRRTFRDHAVYASLFDTLRALDPPMIRFSESFRLHSAIAEYLRQEVYRHDGIPFHSRKTDVLPGRSHPDGMVVAALRPEYPLTLIVHDESASQMRNPFEQSLIEPILKALAGAGGYGYDAETGVGVVVPHRAQRAALQRAFPELCEIESSSGLVSRSAIDTVERFQGGERTVILVSATGSDRGYLLASSKFLLDPRRLTVALSRAKRKMILVASRTIFELFSPDEEVFLNSLLWKNLLLRTCTTSLWKGTKDGRSIEVWGGQGFQPVANEPVGPA
jgi:AAA domain/PD-(D/E)XK nuclease superfamily